MKIVGNDRRYTFHSHTQFCDGRASVMEMARAAVDAGFSHYGFSPHSPLPIDSPCNMSASQVDEYFHAVREVKEAFAGSGCSFYTGMEVDYLGEEWGPSNPYFASLGLDFVIGSVHFIPSQDGEYVDIDGRFENFSRKMRDFFRGDIEYVVDKFYSQSLAMVEAGCFDILGHFDKIGQNADYYAPGIEDSEFYRKRVGALIDRIIEKNLLIELNTKAYKDHGRFFPGVRYLPRLVNSGIRILVNSDAHYPDRIDASRAEAFKILESVG